jgi:hypothetical protein
MAVVTVVMVLLLLSSWSCYHGVVVIVVMVLLLSSQCCCHCCNGVVVIVIIIMVSSWCCHCAVGIVVVIVVSGSYLWCTISTAGQCPEEGPSTVAVPDRFEIAKQVACSTVNVMVMNHYILCSYGRCEPYAADSDFCEDVIPNTDFVYTPLNTSQSDIITQLVVANITIQSGSAECQSLVKQVVCNVLLPSCGNPSGVHRPISVCSEECNYVARICADTLNDVQVALRLGGLEIDCSDTTSRLSNLSGCCSNANVTLPGMLATPTPDCMSMDPVNLISHWGNLMKFIEGMK